MSLLDESAFNESLWMIQWQIHF